MRSGGWGEPGSPQEYLPLPLQDSCGPEGRLMQGEGKGEEVRQLQGVFQQAPRFAGRPEASGYVSHHEPEAGSSTWPKYSLVTRAESPQTTS